MPVIATLTMNPTIDVAYEVERVFHTHKMRTLGEFYAPGGGGINVARVFVRLGGNARCIYLSGGATGGALDGLIDQHQLVRTRVPIAGQTRVAMDALETSTGKEYRFTPAGPHVEEAEWQACLDALDGAECDWLVASGSLPRGVPDDFYALVAQRMAARGIRMVLDSSGEALRQGLAGGGIALVKPSRGELEGLVGQKLPTPEAVADAALALVTNGQAQIVAATLGHEGAVLAHEGGTLYAPALPIEAKSAVGAGDSFVAGMVYALATDASAEEAFRHGVAAGSAAVLRAGTDLARADDIARLLPQVRLD
ncbi:1-phosphofructokinase family hexose kinase [Novosphingobium sp. KCTC 2891]|uniref:1-phosphofructokinase family hexose kinase n=1 Tax=Novosphingobium sp. KCTC 2891 TaxID=2989730 RepID=UPI00222214A1|nr:1-phosphofructokinase family hexose kinase [Novosphingobium sp. KCTC 2891]MCW1382058.1 1-phosphofructokinase family hexose kinase [Novosphingobium sp. KCTC 2891]